MDEKKIINAYIKALVEAPISIVFLLLDIVAVIAVIMIVVDDSYELFVVLAFIIIVHLGHYLIFKKQQIAIIEYEEFISINEESRPALSLSTEYDDQLGSEITIDIPKLQEEPDLDSLVQKEAKELITAYSDRFDKLSNPSYLRFPQSVRQSLFDKKVDEEDYQIQCDEYLVEYKNHLIIEYKISVLDIRLISLHKTEQAEHLKRSKSNRLNGVSRTP